MKFDLFQAKTHYFFQKITISKYFVQLNLRAWILLRSHRLLHQSWVPLKTIWHVKTGDVYHSSSILPVLSFSFNVHCSIKHCLYDNLSATEWFRYLYLWLTHFTHSFWLIQLSVPSRVSFTCYALSFICLSDSLRLFSSVLSSFHKTHRFFRVHPHFSHAIFTISEWSSE